MEEKTIVQKIIEASKLSQKQMALKLDVPESRISEYKKGKVEIPFTKVVDWCNTLNVNLKKLI